MTLLSPAALARLAGNAPWAASLHYRDFRLLWASTLLFSLGTGMETVAVGWLILNITESPFMVGVAAAARMAPFFFLGILSGAMSDHLDRRGFLIGINLTGCIVAGIIALMLLSGEVRVWPVIVLVAAGGCVLVFALTTRQAYTYDIVGPSHALNGLSLASMAMQAGGVVGSLASGVLIGVFGPGWLYVVVGVSYIAATVVLFGTGPIVESVKAHQESILSNLAGYVRISRENRILLVLMCLASIAEVLGFTHMTLLPVFAKEVLFVGPVGLGVMTAVRQGGGFVGLTLLASLRDYRRKGMLMFVIAGAFGLALMAFSLSTNLFFFLAVLAVVNACAMAVDTLYKALMQENVAEEERGRAMGSWVLSIGTAPVGHLGVGGLAGLLGAPGALLLNGGVLAFVSLGAAIGLPRLRRLP